MNMADLHEVVTLDLAITRKAELADALNAKQREMDKIEGAYREICSMCDYLQNVKTAIEEQKKAAGGYYSKQMDQLQAAIDNMPTPVEVAA